MTQENIALFKKLSFAETIACLENLDDAYYRTAPSIGQMAARYGEPENTEYYSERDLYLKYRHRCIADHKIKIYDINDERRCCSRRF